MGLLENRVAILTGGAGDLGSHMTRLFAAEGASVFINDVNEQAATLLAQEIEKSGGQAVADTTDITTGSGGQAVVQRALAAFGTVDILVLLAGRYVFKELTELTEADWDAVTSTHLKGTFTVIRAAAPVMMDKHYGRIITVSSVQGTIGDSHMVPYCAAKSGVIGLTRAAAIELDRYNICVNAICPSGKDDAQGPIASRLAGPCAPNAPLVAYLASEEAGWINGHIFDNSGSGRIGLYPPLIPQRLIEQPGGYTLEEIRTVVPRLFEPTYTTEPRQRPRLIPSPDEKIDHLTEGMSPLFHEMFSSRGFCPPPEIPPKTPWG